MLRHTGTWYFLNTSIHSTHSLFYSQLVEVWQHGEDLAGQRLDAVLAEVPAKQERISFRERVRSTQHKSNLVPAVSQQFNGIDSWAMGPDEQRDGRARDGHTHGG